MNIMLLGNSEAGKTYFLGSLFSLAAHDIGSNGFSLQPKNFVETDDIGKIYKSVKDGLKIPSTNNLKDAPVILRKGVDSVIEIKITDIIGQSVRPGGNIEEGGKLIKVIPNYDAFIIIIECPQNEDQLKNGQIQLAQILNFIAELLSDRKDIPVVLALNKIDLIENSKEIKGKINKKLDEIKSESTNLRKRARDINQKLGASIAQILKPIVCTDYSYALIEQFFKFMQSENHSLPNKVFFCTSSGFDNNFDSSEKIELQPYGTGAAFFWAIYASLKSKKQQLGVLPPDNNSDEIADALLEDIKQLFTSGKAYFDDNHEDSIWHLRNISWLYDGETWNS